MKPLLVAHAEDPDGRIAEALAMRYLSNQGADPADRIPVRYDRIVEAFQKAASLAENYDTIYIADIDLNLQLQKAAGENLSLLEKISRGRNVSWFDHHSGTLKNKEKLAQMGIQLYYDKHQCAALLLQRHFSLKDPYSIKLAKIAQAHDYKNDSSDAENILIGEELEKIIAVGNEKLNYGLLLVLSQDLQNENVFDGNFKVLPPWQQYADDFDSRAPSAYQELENSVEVITAGNYTVLFGYCPALLSKPGAFHLREKYEDKADAFVCLFKSPARNHLVLKTDKSPFPVASFVQSLGGGGRGNGGGFSLDYDITPENYSHIKEMLLSQMEKYSQ